MSKIVSGSFVLSHNTLYNKLKCCLQYLSCFEFIVFEHCFFLFVIKPHLHIILYLGTDPFRNFVIHTYDNIIKEDDLGRFCAVCMKKLRNGSVPKYNIIWRCGFITNKKKQCSKTINSKHDKYCKQHFNLLYNVLCDKTKLPDTILDIFFEYL